MSCLATSGGGLHLVQNLKHKKSFRRKTTTTTKKKTFRKNKKIEEAFLGNSSYCHAFFCTNKKAVFVISLCNAFSDLIALSIEIKSRVTKVS